MLVISEAYIDPSKHGPAWYLFFEIVEVTCVAT